MADPRPIYMSRKQLQGRMHSSAAGIDFPNSNVQADHSFRATHGVRVPDADIPTAFKPGPLTVDNSVQNLPAFFVGRLLIVEKGIADLLQKMDLGQTSLHPMIYQANDDDHNKGRMFFFVNISEARRLAIPSEELGFKKVEGTEIILLSRGSYKGRTISVQDPGEDLPALWRDTQIPDSLFFSTSCRDALIENGYEEAFDLIECDYASSTLDPRLPFSKAWQGGHTF